LAVVVDDIAMEISEVVRGQDLLISTARQMLIYEALGATPPQFYHAPLVIDSEGDRLAKTHQSMSLRELKQAGYSPEDLRKSEAWWSGIEDSFES
jgi:glutamyl-tRNA synthetase